jgi:predicted transcriptional regulator
MTLLSRLARKGLLQRHKRGRYFVYAPATERADFLRQRIGQVTTCLTRNFPAQS